jgi:hypothetical protein
MSGLGKPKSMEPIHGGLFEYPLASRDLAAMAAPERMI